ncbi:hypothetical protein D3C78_909080 [compost metagenome]
MLALFPILGCFIVALPLWNSTFVISSLYENTIYLGVCRSGPAADFSNGLSMDIESKKKRLETKQSVKNKATSLSANKRGAHNAA